MNSLSRSAKAIACMTIAFAVIVAGNGCGQKVREEIRGSLWDVGSTVAGGEHDVWVEYSSLDFRVIGVYRDFDGDGFVDERITFCGPIVAVYTSSSHNGTMDTVRNVLNPHDRGQHIAADAPEAGPFTREKLDKLVRDFPRARADRPQNNASSKSSP
jgi:hypothetical protein